MQIRNEELYGAMKDYVAAAIAFIGNRTRCEPNFNEEYFDSYWVSAKHGTDFAEVPNYARCFEVVKADRVISEQLNQRVGLTPSPERLMVSILELGKSKSEYTFNESRFDKEYSAFEATFYDECLACSAIAPVKGLLWEGEPLRLEDGLEISQLSREELPWNWTTNSEQWSNVSCAVRVRYELPKFFRGQTDRLTYNEHQRGVESEVRDQIDWVMNSLRFFCYRFDFYYLGVLFQKPRWLNEQYHWAPNRMLGSGMGSYRLQGPDCKSFKSFWQTVHKPQVRNHVEIAIRRLGDSCVRERNEDKLVDLMIASESLFLRGKPRARKSSALAKAASDHLTEDHEMRRQIEKQFKFAYQLRNAIVHEGHLKDIPDLNGDALEDIVGKIESYVWLAIKRISEN